MKRQRYIALCTILLLAGLSMPTLAASDMGEDTDTRLIDAQVVEVADSHIAVIARTGVEHVIAIDNSETKVIIDGRTLALREVREGDIVTVELDEKNPVKFARHIQMRSDNQLVARIRP